MSDRYMIYKIVKGTPVDTKKSAVSPSAARGLALAMLSAHELMDATAVVVVDRVTTRQLERRGTAWNSQWQQSYLR